MKYYKKTNGRLSDDGVEEIVQSVVASSRLEGYHASDDVIDMLKKYARGEVSKEQYKTWVLEKAGVNI